MRSTPYIGGVSLLVLNLAAVLAIAGCGATPTEATPPEATPTAIRRDVGDEPCGETGTPNDYACVDGRVPRDHVARKCVLYSSIYSIDFWRCEGR